jgi:single-strand DNA-binding protein
MQMINKVILVGHVGADPEIRTLDSGVTVANMNIATSERWKDKDGNKQESTEWHRIVLWRGLAEVARNWVEKGSQVYIDGKIKTRKFTDKNNVERYITEVYADTLKLLGRARSEGGGNEKFEQQASAIPQADNSIMDEPDDLPF